MATVSLPVSSRPGTLIEIKGKPCSDDDRRRQRAKRRAYREALKKCQATTPFTFEEHGAWTLIDVDQTTFQRILFKIRPFLTLPPISLLSVEEQIRWNIDGPSWGVGKTVMGTNVLFLDCYTRKENSSEALMESLLMIDDIYDVKIDTIWKEVPRPVVTNKASDAYGFPWLEKISIEFKKLTPEINYEDLAKRVMATKLDGVTWTRYQVLKFGSWVRPKEVLKFDGRYDRNRITFDSITSALRFQDLCFTPTTSWDKLPVTWTRYQMLEKILGLTDILID
ncbi:hypothetical protein PENTCL1PPCAC_25333 [Pristionchus entomophagus]|uniref:Uncharacterized protein n=1 Tax=Pristionchus entomophagus TaxID=358040 RepID=A0AAV5U9Y2_9BILA|nr:hypothetical protein PENTCL1PPCAC_25332 [Pristionchus entomophagus]GMT03159.1 hypothetical protein PENTCL1PPCAC_25333 [Pristionchus entomophagus]